MKLAAVIGVTAATAAAAVLAGAAAPAAPQPSLRLEKRSPLIVRGEHFRRGETVKVTAITGYGPRTATAFVRGSGFRVILRVAVDGCGTVKAIRARGNRGSVATLALDNVQVCLPPPLH